MTQYECITLTADIIIEYEDGSIVLIKRKHDPYKGHWAIPGGILEGNETIEETAVREAKEETGLDVKLTGIVGVYSKAGRDTRWSFVTVAYTAVPAGCILKGADDAQECLKTKDFATLQLAFDHNQIIADYLKSKG
jgi:8-oxo-dGTP diphosphatase